VNRPPNHRPHLPHRQGGLALVIVLGFIVLLCLLVVAYFGRTTTDRQLAGASFNQMEADTLARGALDIIVADFKQEIASGSTSSILAGVPTYTPTLAANVLPQRTGTQATTPNLIRRSASPDSIPSPGVGSRASAVNSTTDVSANGRSISLARWNSHYLIPKSNLTDDASDPVASFVAPDWILLSRNGPSVQGNLGSGVTALNNRAVTNANYVIGRYAFAVYDEGGLLDINVAGFPSPTPAPASVLGRKGTISFADLTALPTTSSGFVTNTAINRIVAWRNYATVQPTGIFPGFTFTATASSNFATYFLDTARNFGVVNTAVSGGRTDQAFINRAQLIQLRSDISASVNMLQYLATFSREANRPTWGTGSLTSRFPLARLGQVVPNPGNAAAVKADFGLVWNSDHWEYWGSSGAAEQSTIPAITGASADFFQLLTYGRSNPPIVETLTLGASLIDQYDTDNTTTVIEYAGGPPPSRAYGMESLAIPTPSPAPSPPPGAVILNRPFRNVGEFGYAYKSTTTTLDFKSNNADAPLLDLFTYNTATPRSGIVSLNTRNNSVLAAIIKGAFPTEASGSGITNAQATSAATSIVSATTVLPAMGRQDVARLGSAPTTTPFTSNEESRESIARALAEVGQTRTWGLLIDIVAQSGRYPSNAASGPNVANPLANFVVEGEKRYWLHIAIDRLTGEVIDQQLEAVYE
jgi:Tfp pilus assembly protein PilX